MLDINAIGDLGLGVRDTESERSNSDLGQDEFLTLMLEQFRNQDPLSPAESGDFLGQLAQFGTVSGIQGLQDSFESLSQTLFSDQALQASNLVGRNVLTPSNFAALGEDRLISGAVDLPSSTSSLAVRVTDASGTLVRQLDIGQSPGGLTNFSWDGLDDSGQPVAPGEYRFEAQAVQFGVSESIPVLINSEVQSVTFGGPGRGVLLNVKGVGELTLSQVRQIS